MEFEIIENTSRQVKVAVKIPKRSLAIDENVFVDHQDVRDFLAREGISFESCIKETTIDNYSSKPKLTGEWVFAKKVSKPEKKRKTNAQDTTDTTVKTTTSNRKSRRTRRNTASEENKLFGVENLE